MTRGRLYSIIALGIIVCEIVAATIRGILYPPLVVGSLISSPHISLYLHAPAQVTLPNDAPSKSIIVTLPLPRGARPVLGDRGPFFEMMSGSPYLVSAKRTYLLPGALKTYVPLVRHLFEQAGYIDQGNGVSNDAQGYFFGDKRAASLQVGASFKADGRNTLMEYYAAYVLTPVRSPSSLLPLNERKVVLTYGQTMTATDAKELQHLVSLVNGLNRDSRGQHSCTPDHGVVTATFYDRKGETYVVQEQPGCSTLTVNSGPELFDRYRSFEKAVSALIDRGPVH